MTGQQWGRVDDDGTVWVRTGDGERAVGSYPGATPEEALAYFTRKYEDLAAQVSLLEQRLKAGQISPADAETSGRRLAETVSNANAVGDLEGLNTRLQALSARTEERKAQVAAERAAAREKALTARTALVEEAESLASVDAERIQWKTSGDRLRELFDAWRSAQREQRLDRHTEDELWKRFSHARTTFDRKRRHYFGALDQQRSQVRQQKEELVAEAEALAGSTDWGVTAGAYRELMNRWRAAGRASKKDDDALWARFRAAQDAFFAARDSAAAEVDSRFRDNLVVKEQLLVEAEALLPVGNVAQAKAALREIQHRWDAAGKVPRADMSRVEARLRAVEQAVRDAEEDRWRRSNPEARARAEAVVTQLEAAIAGLERDLEKARTNGDAKAITRAEEALTARRDWLTEARRTLADFTS